MKFKKIESACIAEHKIDINKTLLFLKETFEFLSMQNKQNLQQ